MNIPPILHMAIWGAVRESSMLICDNPAHTYHCVPDYHIEQNLRSVLSDCEMVMKKTFAVVDNLYRTSRILLHIAGFKRNIYL